MAEKKSTSGGRRLLRGLLLGVTPLIVVGAVGYHYAMSQRYVTTENAYVKAEIITISSNIDGQVTDVLVGDNQTVDEGAALFVIDPRPFEITLAAAEADMENVRQRIESLRAQYRQGRMELAAAEERIRFLTVAQERQQRLLNKGVGTQANFDQAEHALFMARRRLGVVRENNRMVLAELGGDPKLPMERHPLYMRAKATRDRAELELSHTLVFAPSSGTLSNVTLQGGEYIEAGDPLFALVTIDAPWIEANLKEVQLTHVRVGQLAEIVLDSYPDMTLKARVESISPATGAEFAILPPQNATGNWVKVVQRVPVRMVLEKSEGLDLLRAGMTAEVRIDTGRDGEAAAFIKGVLAGSFGN